MHFEIVGPIINVETIAVHREIRQLRWLNRTFGRARWRKLKGVAVVRLPNGRMPCGIKKILEEAGFAEGGWIGVSFPVVATFFNPVVRFTRIDTGE